MSETITVEFVRGIERDDLQRAYVAAMTARRGEEDRLFFRDGESYSALYEGHGYQDYCHQSSEEEYKAATDASQEAALQVFIWVLRAWRYEI